MKPSPVGYSLPNRHLKSQGSKVKSFALASITLLASSAYAAPADGLKAKFVTPPDTARPWVYWYFMDGNVSKEGIHADLEAMKKAGLGGGIYLEVGIGVPRGPVNFMSPEWQDDFAYAVSEAKRLGLAIALGTGPGWTGSGGPWVKPEQSMQHLVASETTVSGPASFNAVLPRPKPRVPFFGEGSMTGQGRQDWLDYYRDEVVLAFPTPAAGGGIADVDPKALYYRAPYSSGTVAPRIPAPASFPAVPTDSEISTDKIIDLTSKLDAVGNLKWDVPAGNWTIMRFGRTTTGQTTRPAPDPGLGFESDKFSKAAVAAHLDNYTGVLLKKLGPDYRKGNSGLVDLHFDSWEMSSQNWTQGFKNEFIKRRGYDPTPYLPAMIGYVVSDPAQSERFLWDLRQTASELVITNHAGYLRDYAHVRNLDFSVEPYDLNPSSDLDLGATADIPMCEFWSRGFGFQAEYSCYEAVSIAHTNGKNIVGAESFTANPGEDWQQYPGSMKNQLDWALCTGINKFVIHRYQHQPKPGQLPGMSMGPYGVHWEASETWWDMVPAFHKYMARTSEMLRQGAPVADILYLAPEGAPEVFTPPPSALTPGLPDRKGYNFDGCSPNTLMTKATIKNGHITFPGGAAYKVLVLPAWETMTPGLLRKITSLVRDGMTVTGQPPLKSPSLSGYPQSDDEVASLATQLWGKAPYAASRKLGLGRVMYSTLSKSPRLTTAKWIWAPGGNPVQAAPVETIYASKTIDIAPGKVVAAAVANFTADNTYQLSINGNNVGAGDNFHNLDEIDISPYLKAGSNSISVVAGNTGDSPNPAGLLGEVAVTYRDDSRDVFGTGSDWSVSHTPGGAKEPAVALGDPGMGPWGTVGSADSIYVSYSSTAAVLKGMGVAPDFRSTEPMRYIHRRLNQGEMYFVGNTASNSMAATATFRTAGYQPEWWNPVTGATRLLSDFKVSGGLTSIPLQLDGYESGIVIFRKHLASKTKSTPNFPTIRTIATLSSPWQVAFDAKWGAPSQTTFSKLVDWSQSTDPGIKYYSGKAVYSTTFDAPSGAALRAGRFSIGLGVVKNVASVKLNGSDLGIVWCDPWQASIPTGLLKPKGNKLEITVANLWINRLIGDEFLPEAERQTQTTYRPYRKNSPLQPSGLLGPVTLLKSSF